MADLKVKVGLDKSGFQTGLAAMENSVASFSGKAKGLIAGAFSFGAIGAGLARAIEKGDQLQDLANRFGVAASSLQEVGNAASLSGGSLEDVASAMNKLAKNAGEAIGGNEQMQESFARIGLSVADLQGMSPQDLFMALSEAVASGSLGMQDFAVAQDLAGRGAATLMETLRMGPDAITANGQAMGVWSDETIAQLSEASDAMKTFENSITVAFGHAAALGNGLIKAFQAVVESVVLLGAAAAEAFSGNFEGAKELVKAAQMVGVEQNRKEAQNNKKASGPRNVDGSGPTADGKPDKLAERSKKELESAEDRYAEAVRRREMASQDANEKIGRTQAELIALQSDAAMLADNTAAKYEKLAEIEAKRLEIMGLQNEAASEAKRLADEQARAKETLAQIEDIRAGRAGPEAERNLLASRAQEAARTARQTESADDILRAEQLALSLQTSIETAMLKGGIDPSSVRQMALKETKAITGDIPTPAATVNGLGASSNPSITAPLDAMTFQQTSQDMVQQFLTGTENIAQSLRDIAATPVMPAFPSLALLETETGEARARVEDCVKRLDAILRVSGTFGV